MTPAFRLLLWMGSPVSDLYMSYVQNGQNRFLFYPEVKVNGSTAVSSNDLSAGELMEKRSVVETEQSPVSTMTSVRGSIEPDDKRFEYFLSEDKTGNVAVPVSMASKLSFFNT